MGKSEVLEAKDKAPALSAPLRLVIDLTSRCNLRCAYCCFFSRPDESEKTDLPPERWVSLIDEAGKCGVLRVTLRGGEALLSPAFDAVLEAVIRNNMRFSRRQGGDPRPAARQGFARGGAGGDRGGARRRLAALCDLRGA